MRAAAGLPQARSMTGSASGGSGGSDSRSESVPAATTERVPIATIAREWTRIGCIGFGGPPAHIRLLRDLCVTRRRWLTEDEFEDGIAACNLLPGPASTQLAILSGWRLRGRLGAVVAGTCFIVPGLVLILGLAALFLTGTPPRWVQGTANGAGAAVPAVALSAALELIPASRRRSWNRARWLGFFLVGAASAVLVGPFLVLVLLVCGLIEIAVRRATARRDRLRGVPGPAGGGARSLATVPMLAKLAGSASGFGALGGLAWVALKVGGLSYGGGFVIIPLMQSDAVGHYHWMTAAEFLNAVALGQITPGPVVQTVAVVGYAAAGIPAALMAAAIAFAPSFLFVLLGAAHFDRIRRSRLAQGFLAGAGPAVIGAIAGSALPLSRALSLPWQFGVLAGAAVWMLLLRRGAVPALLMAGGVGAIAALTGAPIAH